MTSKRIPIDVRIVVWFEIVSAWCFLPYAIINTYKYYLFSSNEYIGFLSPFAVYSTKQLIATDSAVQALLHIMLAVGYHNRCRYAWCLGVFMLLRYAVVHTTIAGNMPLWLVITLIITICWNIYRFPMYMMKDKKGAKTEI